MSQGTPQSELLSSAQAAERNFSTNNIVGGGCVECACEALVFYHYDDGKGIPEAPFEMTDAKDNVYTGKTDKNGLFKAENIACGTFDILFDEGSDEFTPLETVANNPALQSNPEYAAIATEYFTLYDYLHQKGHVEVSSGGMLDWGKEDISHDIARTRVGRGNLLLVSAQDERAIQRFRELAKQIENDNGPLEAAIIKSHHQLAGEAGDSNMAIMMAAELILGCVPVVGSAIDVKDCAIWLYDGIVEENGADFSDPLYLGMGALNVIGFVPGLGDAIKKSGKPILKFMRKTDDMATAGRKIRQLSNGNLIQFLRKITGQLKKYANEAVKIAVKIATGIASLVKKAAKWLWDSVLSVLRKFADYAKKLVQWIKEAVANLKTWIDDFIGKFFVKKTGTSHKTGHTQQTDLNAGADKDVNTKSSTDVDETANTSDKAKDAENPCPTGNPVNPVTGQVLEHQQDIQLPTSPALHLSRHYAPNHPNSGVFGAHWHSNLDSHLRVEDDGFYYLNPELAEIHYYDPDPGEQSRNTQNSGERLCRTEQDALYLLNPEGQRLYFGYALGSRLMLSAMEDNNGNRIDIQRRPSDGFPLALRHNNGQALILSSAREEDELDARISQIQHYAAGQQTPLLDYHYDPQQRLSHIKGPLPHTGAQYQYNPQGQLCRRQDSTNQTWAEYDYDAANRVIAQRSTGDHYNGRFEYQPGHTRYHTPAGGLLDYHYDSQKRITRIETCLGATYQNEWENHLLTARIDPLGRETGYTYDDWGQMTQITHPDGRVEQIERDAQGRATAYTDPAGAVWQYHYDERGNLSQLTNPLEQAMHYAYNAQGQLTQVDYPGGGQSHYRYDPAGHLSQLISPDGQHHQYRHDNLGRLSEYRDPENHRQQWFYPKGNHLPLPESHLSAQGHRRRQQYNAQGQLMQSTDANGNSTRYQWGPYSTLQSLTDPQGRTYQFHYGANAELSEVTNPQGEHYRYVRDKAGRIIEEHDFAGAITRYDYDLVGRLVRTQKPDGAKFTYSYDTGDRLIEKTITPKQGEPSQTTYQYDAAGNLLSAQNAHSLIEFERDKLGRIIQENHPGRSLETTYNADGYRAALKGEGIEQQWHYGPGQQLQQLQFGQHSELNFQYSPRGQETYRYSGQGFGLIQQYDPEGLLSQQQAGIKIPDLPGHLPHAPTIDRQYQYDPGGRLSALKESLWGHAHYQYDRSDRITQAAHGHRAGDLRHKEIFTYNDNGDLQNVGRSEMGNNVIDLAQYQKKRHYHGGKVYNIGNAYYLYDANGRLVEKRENKKGFRPQSWHYQWDSEDQLIQVTKPDGEQWQYAYDPFGRRIRKSKTHNSKHDKPLPEGYDLPIKQGNAYQWDGDRLIQEAPIYADGTVAWDQAETWHYEANSFKPIAKEQHGKLFYIITDHLGTPREMLDESGIPVWRAKFSVWGELLDREAPNDPDYGRQSCNLRFQGQQYDPETGLHYNRHRYYDPVSAQYLSPDPIGLAGGLTPQAYVHDPNGWVDPLGLNPCGPNAPKRGANKLDDALAQYNKNDIHHLFGRGGDAPTKLIDKFGSPNAALRELQKSAQSIANKNYQTGSWVTVKVGDTPVTIQGRVMDGIFRISSIAKREF